ncbi:Uncharacterised protein [Mycobacteroides abscessus subsp. abscessus]|nr:Uncharacterised protein [Mycobacteroides abscessus subsp. abscessus]
MPRASRCNAAPMLPPSSDTASDSGRAANAPTVSIPSVRSLPSATGPIPHSLRTGSAASSRCCSAGETTRMPSGAQNSCTRATLAPASSAGSPNASSNDSVSSTGMRLRSASKTRPLISAYTAPRGGTTTALTPTSRLAWCIGIAERAPYTLAS